MCSSDLDERDLWGECVRVLRDLRPKYALWENVGGLLTSESGLFFNRVCSDLAESGYDCLWQIIPASAVGAPHRRDRVWIVAVMGDCEQPRLERHNHRKAAPVAYESQRANSGAASVLHDFPGWPSRPGEQQYEWEPPRVVGDTASQRPPTRRAEPTGQQRQAGTAGADATMGDTEKREGDGRGSRGVAEAQGCGECGNTAADASSQTRTDGQVESALGGNADGLPGDVVRVGEEVFWRSPTAEEAGAKVETLYTKDGKPAQPGERAYRLQPNGELVLQSVTLNQQVVMDGMETKHTTIWPEVHNRVAQLKGYGNAIVPQCAAIILKSILDYETQTHTYTH